MSFELISSSFSGVFQSERCHEKRNHASILTEGIIGGLERQQGDKGITSCLPLVPSVGRNQMAKYDIGHIFPS